MPIGDTGGFFFSCIRSGSSSNLIFALLTSPHPCTSNLTPYWVSFRYPANREAESQALNTKFLSKILLAWGEKKGLLSLKLVYVQSLWGLVLYSRSPTPRSGPTTRLWPIRNGAMQVASQYISACAAQCACVGQACIRMYACTCMPACHSCSLVALFPPQQNHKGWGLI